MYVYEDAIRSRTEERIIIYIDQVISDKHALDLRRGPLYIYIRVWTGSEKSITIYMHQAIYMRIHPPDPVHACLISLDLYT